MSHGPVTNLCRTAVNSLRAAFGSIDLGVKSLPIGNRNDNIVTASIADDLSPLIHNEHEMDTVLNELDFWALTCGTTAVQSSWDRDISANKTFVPSFICLTCGSPVSPEEEMCSVCGGVQFDVAKEADGSPMGEMVGAGKGKTEALSPFEFAISPGVTRFQDSPYVIRARWREKSYYEANYPDIVEALTFGKSASDRNIQIYKGLALLSEVSRSDYGSSRESSSQYGEGITEYEFWMKPTNDYPEGLVFRVVGDQEPKILHSPKEELPGPLPYKDQWGSYLWPFADYIFERNPGRFYGYSLLDSAVPKQDQINQLDSHFQMIARGMANPVWIMPRGAADLQEITGTAGAVIRWNPNTASGTAARPDRIPGQEIPASLMKLRETYIAEFEDLTGVFEILKGQKPTGAEAFSALQLLVERSQARFTSCFQSRSSMYRKWYEVALDLERQYGPVERTMSLIGHNGGYAYKYFKNAQIQGNVSITIEDGTNVPKTPLGKRAAMEHANQMGLLGRMARSGIKTNGTPYCSS